MKLCSINDLEENKAKGFSLNNDPQLQDIVLIKRDDIVYGYKNNCPHTGVNLNWMPDQFMDLDEFYIQCSVHGALFNIEDGLCVRGPCVNQSLTPISLKVDGSDVYYVAE